MRNNPLSASSSRGRAILLAVGLNLASIIFLFTTSSAQSIKIVAFGGSNTYGKNLARAEAYPAQLEVMLKAAGYDVVIDNAGTNGQTTADELAKFDSAIPEGTELVIFQPGGNDARYNSRKTKLFSTKESIDTERNIKTIVQKMLDRKILVIFAGPPERRGIVEEFNLVTIDEINRLAANELQDDRKHLTANGYKIVAEKIFPLVKEMLDKILANRAEAAVLR